MALGAEASNLRNMVIRKGMTLTGLGVLLGMLERSGSLVSLPASSPGQILGMRSLSGYAAASDCSCFVRRDSGGESIRVSDDRAPLGIAERTSAGTKGGEF